MATRSDLSPRREPPNARTVAARVLERVERDGAYAAAALDAELERSSGLDVRDRALATEIVYGVLRAKRFLSARVAQHAPRGLPDDVLLVAHLLVAAYQVLFLDRVPSHAAVNGAVSAIKLARSEKTAGFANAILRKVAAGSRVVSREEAIFESAPPWLVAELERAVGSDEARALLGAGGGDSGHVSVRVSADAPADFLAGAGRGLASPLARLLPRGGDLRHRDGYADGAFTIQEEAAQVVALAVGARPGERVLDACAGRGQKTTLLRERLGPDAMLWATDLYPEKLQAQAAEFARLKLRPPITRAVDYAVGVGDVPDGFDRVLVDAPCTGTGTLRRRPEIALRLGPEDPWRLGALGASILERAASRARPGGRVVFAVCSVLRQECEDVVHDVAHLLEPAPFDAPDIAHLVSGEATTLRLSPLLHGTDGFFIASFRRRG